MPRSFGARVIDVPFAQPDPLPRMDVPVFVGFAERGPLHRPVLVEDATQYADVFGDPLDLAESDDGTMIQAHLGPAVSSFLAGGGERCYVIRVAADTASDACFSVEELQLWTWREKKWVQRGAIRLRTSTAGSWADKAELSARLRSTALAANSDVKLGDVLRVRRESLQKHRDGYLVVQQPGAAEAAFRAAQDDKAVLWLDREQAVEDLSTTPDGIELLTVDLSFRRPYSASRQPSRRTWQRDDCQLGFGVSGSLPWFEPDLLARMDAGMEPSANDWPLAGFPAERVLEPDKPDAVWMIVPHTLPPSFTQWHGAVLGDGDRLQRNGLSVFSSSLFVDPSWDAQVTGSRLLQWADDVRYFGQRPRRLRGMHAALGYHGDAIREATWLAVPDAVHTGWRYDLNTPAITEELIGKADIPADPPIDREPSRFECCAKPPIRAPSVPVITLPPVVNAGLEWPINLSIAPEAVHDDVGIELQIADFEDFSDARPLPLSAIVGTEPPHPNKRPEWVLRAPGSVRLTLGSGLYYVRARAWRYAGSERGDIASAWSRHAATIARPAERLVALPAPSASAHTETFGVHAALIDLVSATREHCALLSVPQRWDESSVAEHAKQLRALINGRADGAQALSFAALHHPWVLQTSDAQQIRAEPAEGALLAQYARRTRSRGAWAIGGLESLVDSFGVASKLEPGLLEALGCNPVELLPRGVMATRAASLDTDSDWLELGVRRLFIVLRKLVRREGERYAFEPNDMVLRRSLEQTFEEQLRQLMQRGALRGARREEAFRLQTARGAQLSQEIERGQCIMEIRVAPSLPLRFLTLYAVRTGDQWQLQEAF